MEFGKAWCQGSGTCSSALGLEPLGQVFPTAVHWKSPAILLGRSGVHLDVCLPDYDCFTKTLYIYSVYHLYFHLFITTMLTQTIYWCFKVTSCHK